MTISNTTNRVSYTGNASTTAFPVAFPFHETSDLVVIETIIATGVQTTQVITTDYTVSGTQNAEGLYDSGGTVNAVTAPAATVTWTIYRDVPLTQDVDLVEGDPLPVESSVEDPLDRGILISQRTREIVTRSLRQPEGDTADIAALPAKVDRASMYLGFDSSGNPTPLTTPTDTSVTTPYTLTLLDDANAAAARTTLDAAQAFVLSRVNDFRLSLTTAVPVTIADVTAAGTLYCIPYKGNVISLYDGSAWNNRASAEFSLSLTLTSGKPYDVFCYDNAGVPTLEVLVWTNDTTRATAIAYQDGVLVKSGAVTRRYLGTLYASGTDTTEDSTAKRYLWNYYHRVDRLLNNPTETTNTWVYATAAWRQANANASNQFDFIIGVNEDVVSAQVFGACGSTFANLIGNVGIGLDSTTTESSDIRTPGIISPITANVITPLMAIYKANVAAGKHYLAWLERCTAAGTTTWRGDNNNVYMQSGISGSFRA